MSHPLAPRAIDVILVPDAPTIAVAREANARLRASGEETDIDLERAWPHLSLMMGLVDAADLDAITEALRPAATSAPRRIASRGIELFRRRENRGTMWIGYDASPELHALQGAIASALAPFLRGKVKPEHFHPDCPRPDDGDAAFATDYIEIATGPGFDPHVTLGRCDMDRAPEVSDLVVPNPMMPAALALAWLGPGCTCPEILRRLDLD